jgi:hypothetical protein
MIIRHAEKPHHSSSPHGILPKGTLTGIPSRWTGGFRRRHYGQADPGGDQPSHGLPRTYPLTVLRPVDGVVTEAATFAVRDVPARSAHPVRGLGPESESVDDVVLGHSCPTTEAPTIGRLTALDAGLPAYR